MVTSLRWASPHPGSTTVFQALPSQFRLSKPHEALCASTPRYSLRLACSRRVKCPQHSRHPWHPYKVNCPEALHLGGLSLLSSRDSIIIKRQVSDGSGASETPTFRASGFAGLFRTTKQQRSTPGALPRCIKYLSGTCEAVQGTWPSGTWIDRLTSEISRDSREGQKTTV